MILRILDHHARAIGLKPSHTLYHKWGRGKRITLRFSKSGVPGLEAAYSRHYVATGQPASDDLTQRLDAIREGEELSRRRQVGGVRFFIINREMTLSGAQLPDALLAAFNQALGSM